MACHGTRCFTCKCGKGAEDAAAGSTCQHTNWSCERTAELSFHLRQPSPANASGSTALWALECQGGLPSLKKDPLALSALRT